MSLICLGRPERIRIRIEVKLRRSRWWAEPELVIHLHELYLSIPDMNLRILCCMEVEFFGHYDGLVGQWWYKTRITPVGRLDYEVSILIHLCPALIYGSVYYRYPLKPFLISHAWPSTTYRRSMGYSFSLVVNTADINIAEDYTFASWRLCDIFSAVWLPNSKYTWIMCSHLWVRGGSISPSPLPFPTRALVWIVPSFDPHFYSQPSQFFLDNPSLGLFTHYLLPIIKLYFNPD